MEIEEYLGQIVVVLMDDGTRFKGLLKSAGINPGTGEEHVEINDGNEVFFVPIVDIERIEMAALN